MYYYSASRIANNDSLINIATSTDYAQKHTLIIL